MFWRTAMAGLAAWTLWSTGCSKAPSPEQCGALVEHLVELDQAESKSNGKAAVFDAVGERTTSYCLREVSRAKVECALAAKTLEEASRCDQD
jgi:hypothetical protein